MNEALPGFVHASGAGINHLTPWDTGKMHVCNARGVRDESMAQFAIARPIAMNCNFFLCAKQQQRHEWSGHSAPHSVGGTLTLTVVGLGGIGKACARVGHTPGMTVYGVRARPQQPCEGVEAVVSPADMHDVLSQSDCVIVVTPLTDDNPL